MRSNMKHLFNKIRFSITRFTAVLLFVSLLAPNSVSADSQTFTSSGTFTVPSYVTLTVTVKGAGGGGGGGKNCCLAGSGGTGVTGGNSSFNSTVVGNGGAGGTGGTQPTPNGSTGASGTASGGDTNTTGGGAAGGVGGSGTQASGGSGGPGGLAVKTYSFGGLTQGSSISVVVGAGGAGGAGADGGSTGGTGTDGSVVVTWTPPFTHSTITITGNVKFTGNLTITGALSKGSGTFMIDHPLYPQNYLLLHSFVESPDAKNMYNGTATLDENGEVIISLPDYFDALNKDVRYQFFALDRAMPNLHIKEEEHDNQFTLGGGVPNGRVSWQVTGMRHDPYILAHPIIVEVWKGAGQPVNRGECLYEPLCI
jgi:hypothetical protein